MSKLEDAVKQQDELYKLNPKFQPKSINEIAMAQVANLLFLVKVEKIKESQAHLFKMRKLERNTDSLHAAGLILSGKPGFLRCPQGWGNLQSGFTTLEEIIMHLTEPMVDVATVKMNAGFGMELWAIDERGMMTLIDSIRDSSD